MICGAELGEREKYCGSCGAKAPDGAVEKEEIEPKYITKEKPHEPWMDYSWDAHNFIHEWSSFRPAFAGSIFELFWNSYIVIGIILIITTINKGISLHTFISFFLALLFICEGCFGSWAGCRVCEFKKNGPKFYYIACLTRVIPVFMTAFLFSIIDGFVMGMWIWCLFEAILDIVMFIVSYKYYERRKKAFIN